MEQRNGSDSDKRNFKNRTGIFPHSENDRITESAESPGICGRLPVLISEELSVISAKEFEDMQKRKSGRGRDDSRPYPFTDLFDLRAYASAVYILSFDGKRLPDVKG